MNEVLLKELISLANDLDKAGLSKEADKVDKLIKEANPLLLIGCIPAKAEEPNNGGSQEQ
ncbi:hypothetical protein CMI47_01455 [Candidatus Pacearchaeota archaeon]|nr:hypothetical protein [Candidatus Pacearchaeota archaeon]|tara:strand:- start:2041 stop:2220 length:180 start_codon:yes stop_codon:yes gene_type:complete